MAQNKLRANATDLNIGAIAIARKRFAENAVSGALAMIDPWSSTPHLALESIRLAMAAARQSLGAPPLGKAAFASHQPKLASLAGIKSFSLDEQLLHNPRASSASQAWRLALADCFLETLEGLHPAQILNATSAGTPWLAQAVAEKIKAQPEQARSVARSFCKARQPKLAHAMAILPLGEHIFVNQSSTSPSSSMARALVEDFLGWKNALASAPHIAQSLKQHQDLALLAMEQKFNTAMAGHGADGLLAASYHSVGEAPFDALSAYIVYAFCSAELQKRIGDTWIEAKDASSIPQADIVASLLNCPTGSFPAACKLAAKLPNADNNALCVALARLTALPQASREIAANACLGWARKISQHDPAWHSRPSPQSTLAQNKSLSSNFAELVLRACVQWKTSSKPVEALSAMLALAVEHGYDPQASRGGVPSAIEKLGASKNAESRAWTTRIESLVLNSHTPNPIAATRAAPRL